MALVKLTEYGYGQLELNLVAFPRDGRVVAQYKAGTTFTGAEGDEKYLENGMLLKVDGAKRCVDKADPTEYDIFALNYSTEHMYDERTYRLADFRLNSTNDFYPRLGYLAAGDKFTTNCVCVDPEKEGVTVEGASTQKETVEAAWKSIAQLFEAGTLIYGGACANGYIQLSKTAPEYGPVLRVIQVYTMPDGQKAVKLEVLRG